MSKNVVVIASGETERRTIPHLVNHLEQEDSAVVEVLRPDGNKALSVDMVEKLIKVAWYAPTDNITPDKFVVLIDTDGKNSVELLRPFREQLPRRIEPTINATVQFAFAQWHLEAWYFADASGLRSYLGGRDLGNIDSSQPDQIENPKLHLKHLLGDRAYTSVVSEQIGRQLDVSAISSRSSSFRGFLDAVRNGNFVERRPDM
jgi:hypothetical protein